MRILGIETSADDTGIALIEAEGAYCTDFSFKVLANEVSSQNVHAEYGGIYPNLAKREHAKNLPLLLEKMPVSHVYNSCDIHAIDAIAVTVGPGLEPCLWEGIEFAKKLAVQWHVPIVPVNHMEGHIVISMMDLRNPSLGELATFEFPALALLVSGGHTELILMKSFGQYEYIGRTRDDAAGEAFDKVARLLGLPYPGGPEISRLAEHARKTHEASPRGFKLPRPMMHENSYDFSFAGLKTAAERLIKSKPLQSLGREKLACEFEDSVTDVLVYKTLRAVEEYGANAVVMGGGVSANKHIRSVLSSKLEAVSSKLLVCPPQFSTDNGLMIAIAGYFHALKNEFEDPKSLSANGNWKLC